MRKYPTQKVNKAHKQRLEHTGSDALGRQGANLSSAFFISRLGPILGNPMVLVVMLELAMVIACRTKCKVRISNCHLSDGINKTS